MNAFRSQLGDEDMTSTIIIRNERTAQSYLSASHGIATFQLGTEAGMGYEVTGRDEDGNPVWHRRCERCGGSGMYATYSAVDDNVCYRCWGVPERMVQGPFTTVKVARALKARTTRRKNKAKNEAAAEARRQERAATKRQEGLMFLAQHDLTPERLAILGDFGRSLAEGAEKYGSLTPNQLAAAQRSLAKHDANAEAKKAQGVGPAPEGRQEVTGKIIKLTWKHGDYGSSLKATMILDNGSKVYLTVPRKFEDDVNVGDYFTVKASFEVSRKDPHFSFGSRPHGASAKLTPHNPFEELGRAIAWTAAKNNPVEAFRYRRTGGDLMGFDIDASLEAA